MVNPTIVAVLVTCFTVIILMMTGLRIKGYGLITGITLGLLRAMWLSPFLLVLFPKNITLDQQQKRLPFKVSVYLDDSSSMTQENGTLTMARSHFVRAQKHTNKLHALCEKLGCVLQVKRASEEDRRFLDHVSPLRDLTNHITAKDPPFFILFTDGGAQEPYDILSQINNLRLLSPPQENPNNMKVKGLLVDMNNSQPKNVTVQNLRYEAIGFTDHNVSLDFDVYRSDRSHVSQTIQVQVEIADNRVAVQNVTFESHQQLMKSQIKLPLLAAGGHHLTITALPIPGEQETWDNTLSTSIEIIKPFNGVLHLVGSPNPDSRFMRRFLGLDPRFHVISFFILRDPWDIPSHDERDVSLIPFPVDQLFRHELPHFSVVVLQNFRLSEFLSPDHQNLLVDYVKNGGSLLFIGGPRALHYTDSHYSALAEIIPFTSTPQMSDDLFASQKNNTEPTPGAAWYNQDLTYSLVLNQSRHEYSPASSLFDALTPWQKQLTRSQLRGLHQTDEVVFRDYGYQRVIDAHLSSPSGTSQTLPFMMASYVEKGRIIWIYSDSLWRLAMDPDPLVSRSLYNGMINTVFRWLSRDEKTPFIWADNLKIKITRDANSKSLIAHTHLVGPGVKYLNDPQISFDTTLCGIKITQVKITSLSDQLASMTMTSQISGTDLSH
ncbi:MAG: hypothetical protein OXC40_00700, partial [Proteobacteria bacterium]|nr:hypothetical protein [Pseudomonadota bacterium]